VKPGADVPVSASSESIAVESLTFFKEGDKTVQNTPELEPLLGELRFAADELKTKLQPLKDKMESVAGQRKQASDGKSNLMTFCEVKSQLLLNYLTNLSFYCLLKVKGLSIRDHPVIEQLAKVKILLDKLKPVELRLKPQIETVLKSSTQQSSGKSHGAFVDNIEDSEDEDMPGVNADLALHSSQTRLKTETVQTSL
jgi:hypothetical protein